MNNNIVTPWELRGRRIQQFLKNTMIFCNYKDSLNSHWLSTIKMILYHSYYVYNYNYFFQLKWFSTITKIICNTILFNKLQKNKLQYNLYKSVQLE